MALRTAAACRLVECESLARLGCMAMVGREAVVGRRYAMVHGIRSGMQRSNACWTLWRWFANRMDPLLAQGRESAEGGSVSMNSTATSTTTGTLTLSSLLMAVQKVKWAMKSAPPTMPRIVSSPLATRSVPVRVHKKRRNQSDAYHRRVQKKWTKRFGTKLVPSSYLIDNQAIGGTGRTLVMHPELVARLQRLQP